ncbi:MAG: hypothetical protein LLF75_10625 [Eubacteriales bacterium]|nr:hypothetical protein [Eubacteriales bacterium]
MKKQVCLFIAIVFMLLLCGCVKKHTFVIPSGPTTTPLLAQDDSESVDIASNQDQNLASDNAAQAQQALTAPLPDLVPAAIVCDVSDFYVGTEIFFDTGVRNDGAVDSSEFNIKWFVNNVTEGYGGHQGVPAGYNDVSDNSQFYWTPREPGTYLIEFSVDCDDFILESNEENNSVEITIIVP